MRDSFFRKRVSYRAGCATAHRVLVYWLLVIGLVPPSPVGMHTSIMQRMGGHTVRDSPICIPTQGRLRKNSHLIGAGALAPLKWRHFMEVRYTGLKFLLQYSRVLSQSQGRGNKSAKGAGTSVPPNATEVASPIEALQSNAYQNYSLFTIHYSLTDVQDKVRAA